MSLRPLCSVREVRMLQRLFDIGSKGLVKGTLALPLQATLFIFCYSFYCNNHDSTLEMEIHLHTWVTSIVIFSGTFGNTFLLI